MSAFILAVDDEQDIRTALQKLLEAEGYEVAVASSGREAIAAAKARLPDLILLDIKMPGLDGLATFRRLKRIHPEVVVVILTGYGTIATARQAMKLGACDYATKPINLPFLRSVIRDALEAGLPTTSSAAQIPR